MLRLRFKVSIGQSVKAQESMLNASVPSTIVKFLSPEQPAKVEILTDVTGAPIERFLSVVKPLKGEEL